VAGLRKVVRLGLSRTPIGDISPLVSMCSLEIVLLRGLGISDIRALAYCRCLRKLFLSDTQVTSLEPIANCRLERLDIRGTQVSSLTPLSEMYSLKALFASNTNISDVTALSKLEGLEILHLSGNQKVEDIAPLKHLSRLKILGLSGTAVIDLSTLQYLTNLHRLHLNVVWSTEFAVLRDLRLMKRLDLSCTAIQDLSVLSNMSILQRLDLNGAFSVYSLDPLVTSSSLKDLYISDDRLELSLLRKGLPNLCIHVEAEIERKKRLVLKHRWKKQRCRDSFI